MNFWRRIRAPFEVALARLALAILPRLSRRSVLRLARFLGTAGYHCAPGLRRLGLANLAIAFPDADAAWHRATLRQSYRTFALTMLDTFWIARDTRARMESILTIHPGFARVLFRDQRQVCVTAHLGNWEVLGMSVTFRGYPLASVTAPLKNPAVDPLFNDLRKVTGQQTVPKQGAIRHLLRILKEGGKVALVLDQNTRPVDGGIFVNYFGLPVPMSSAAAALACKTASEIVVAGCVPDEEGHYHTTDATVLRAESAETEPEAIHRDITQRIAHALEAMVRTHPGNWVWTYKRWRYRPLDQPAEKYPYYALAVRPADLRPAGPHRG